MDNKQDFPFEDDGAGGNLYEYPISHLEMDYISMRLHFGEDDIDVKLYKKIIEFKRANEPSDNI